MNDFSKSIIYHSESALEALKKLNKVPKTLTLFVLDENKCLTGTLTDGDIRRGLINGLSVNDMVTAFMSTRFHKIENGFSVWDLRRVRDLGIRLLPLLDEHQRIIKVYDLKKRKSILPLECMIMAGGKGKRLRPLTEIKPKPMLPLGNKPIIEHNIDRLVRYGIEKFYISVKYLGQQIVDYLGDGSSKGVSIEYVWEDKPLGTAGALSLVTNFQSDHILVMNSDLFTDVDFEDLYLNTLNAYAEIGISSVPYTVNIPYAIFDGDGNRVLSFKEKPNNTYYANAGIYILKKEIVKRVPYNEFYNITDLIQDVLDSGGNVIQNPIFGYWIDIGRHEDYNKAQEIEKHIR